MAAERSQAKQTDAPEPREPTAASARTTTSSPHARVYGLQRQAGNAAVTKLVQGAHQPSLQRIVWIELPGTDADNLPRNYQRLSDPEKVAEIRKMLGTKSPAVIARAWSLLSNELGVALANPDLFERSLALNKNIVKHRGFDRLRTLFKQDVEQLAIDNTSQNRDYVLEEMRKTGVEAEARGEEPGAEEDLAIQDIQKLAPEMENVKQAKTAMLRARIGTIARPAVQGDVHRSPAIFNPAGPPPSLYYEKHPDMPTWEQIHAQWMRNAAVEAAIIREHPSAAYFMDAGDPSVLKDTTDIKVARAEIAKGLNETYERIVKVVPLIGKDLTFIDFPPLQQQLLGGGPGPSGRQWSSPVMKDVAETAIARANLSKLLRTLGVSTATAAAFVFASFATAGGTAIWAIMGLASFGAGMVGSGYQTAAGWKQYRDIATAHAASIDPELALVTQEQVDAAHISAIMDSIFTALDALQIRAVTTTLRGGRLALEGGKAGALKSMTEALRNLGRAADPKATLIRGLEELGPERARSLTGMSYERMAEAVGRRSELGNRLMLLGRTGLSASTRELLDKLPQLVKLSADEGEKVLRAAVDTYGYIGTLQRVGGWGAIKNSAAFTGQTATAKAMEGWRGGLVKELQEYIAQESNKMATAVRSGTEKAASDLDVQILGDTAAQLSAKADGWLAGRLGMSTKRAKTLLDAEIFIDPLRSHLVDVLKELDSGVRAAISSRMAARERTLVYSARYREALKESRRAAERIRTEARELGVTIMEDFRPLSADAQRRASALLDRKMAELRRTTDPDRKAALVEQIADTQAMINASHPDAYVGGGVRAWVTGRDEDVAKIAEALKISPDELKAITAAQRITAALTEAKWYEVAVKRLSVARPRNTEDLRKLARDVINIGKHGGRAAESMRLAGAPNVAALEDLFARLWRFKEMSVDELAAALGRGELGAIRGEITGLLDRLKGQIKSGVNALEGAGTAIKPDLKQMAEWQSLIRWEATYSRLVDTAKGATGAYVELLHGAATGRAAISAPPPSAPEPNYQPPEGPPIHVR